MKRLIVILCAICFCVNAMAQIQTKFWGLELSKQYTSLREAQRLIASRCEQSEIDNNLNQIIAERGAFGGYDWDYIGFYFYESFESHTLYMVSFFSIYNSTGAAESRHDLLLKALTDKYGKAQAKEGVSFWANQKSDTYCLLKLNEMGDTKIITLDYAANQVLQRSVDENHNEL